MTAFYQTIGVAANRAGPFQELRAMVDTGSAYTWVSRSILQGMGVRPEFTQEFETADGRVIEWEVAEAVVRINGRTRTTLVVFGDEGTTPLLGVSTLEVFSLAADPVHERLVPVRAPLKGVRPGKGVKQGMVRLLLDPEGRPKGIVLSFRAYKRLLARLEDLQDALEPKQAQEQGGEFEDLDAVLNRLKLKKRT